MISQRNRKVKSLTDASKKYIISSGEIMKILFTVNAFLKSDGFSALYESFASAAKKLGVNFEICRNSDSVFPTADAVLFWDKDVFLARKFEISGVRVFNPSRGIDICDSKLKTALCLEEHGLPTPRTLFSPKTFEGVGYTDLSFLENAEKELGYPFIIKEEFGSFGKQVYLVKNRAEAEEVVGKISPKAFVMQEFISDCVGRDLRINVVGDRVVSCIERYNPNDFRSNVAGGGGAKSVMPTERQKALALAAAKASGLDFAGVDILPSKMGDLVCEINSNPHFAGTLSATGVNIAEEIIKYIVEKRT